MAKDNERLAAEKALAHVHEVKMVQRDRAIKEEAKKRLPRTDTLYYKNHLYSCFESKFSEAFLQKKYEKPSEFFLREMPWIFGLVVYDRYKEAFLYMVDRVRDFPYSDTFYRRSHRSDSYVHYVRRIGRILVNFSGVGTLDFDLKDILTGDLPEEVRCYITHNCGWNSPYVPEALAYGLDREDPELEAIVTDIVNGDVGFTRVSWNLIEAMVMCRNPRMHQLLCKLLVAAKLQEGLRQTICERADWGTREAFHAIVSTILDHDLIRYSSVKRAVGTWIGVVQEDTRDLDRIGTKSVELIRDCLMDPGYREECLASEDAMAIHIALWAAAFEDIQKGMFLLGQLIGHGTHHQVLTAGYFVATLENDLLRQTAARQVLKVRRDRNDILAVYLPSFLPYHLNLVTQIIKAQGHSQFKYYFDSNEEAQEFCDWLFDRFRAMDKKAVEFNPCIFPWFSASLTRSQLIEKAMILAAAMGDRERIDVLCPYIGDCEASTRNSYLKMMTLGQKTPAVRKAIIDCLEDKSFDTRHTAYQRACELTLTADEYRRIEEMLRLRYDDLRRNAMELLMTQDDDALEATIRRLLGSSKTQMRTAGLDMVTQLSKSEDRKALAERCMDAVRAIVKPTTQEKVLMDALALRVVAKGAEPLFTEADRYVPVVEIDGYARECIRAFMEVFPDSRLEQQVLAGQPVIHQAESTPASPCACAERARKNLKSLSEYVVAHERDTFPHWSGNEAPIGILFTRFFVYTNDGQKATPRMDLWEAWRDENGITFGDLFGMLVLGNAQEEKFPYLARCNGYIRDIYGAGFDQPAEYRYAEHMLRIVSSLLYDYIRQEQCQKIVTALGIWIARCLPEEMLIGDTGESGSAQPKTDLPNYLYTDPQVRINAGLSYQLSGPAGHFIAHPQIQWLLHKLDISLSEGLVHRIPVALNIFDRTHGSTIAYMERHGMTVNGRVTLILNQIFQYRLRVEKWSQPDHATYLYARHLGLISDRTLYCHLMAPGVFKNSLKLITGVCAMEPKDGETVSSRIFQNYHSHGIRRSYEEFIGKDTLPEERKQLVALCHRAADALVPVVLDAELLRGDTPTDYSVYVTGIHVLSGMDTFVKILCALGKESLDRSVYYFGSSQSKRGNLSYLLARCAPAPGDDAAKLGQLLRGTDITETRLIEAALYSPAWIDIIGRYLDLPGFQSACYYFMAHMNERFDEQKKAIIARFTPLSEDELNLGAFDLAWFHSAYEQLGEKKFDMIYDAARYISDGSKHTRARKYADAALGRLALAETEKAIRDKRNKDLLMAYGIIPLAGEEDLIHRYLFLQQFLKESRQFGAQRSASEKKAVETALRNLATNAGFSDTMRLTLRMETKLVEDNRALFEENQVGEWTFRLVIDDLGNPEILCAKDGKPLKAIPAKAKKDPYVVRLVDMKKQLTEQYRRTRRMFEQAMEDGAEFTLEEMGQLCENPVVAPIVSKLIFKTGDTLGLFDGSQLRDPQGAVLEDRVEAKLSVAHPLHLYRSGNWHRFQQYLFDNKIAQPFRQVFRELYVKTKEELGCYTSLRYAGNQIQPKKAAACLKERRWVADIEAGLQKIYYRDNIVATIFALADWFTPADIEAPTVEHVAFYDRKTGKALKIDDIPDVIFSEVMRDVDMAVSVAHAGAVDPETSHSTVETRGAILSFTLPLLRLGNVTIEGSHAFIQGKLAHYSVHLGSGVVHQLGGTMLNVLPVHSQQRGRFFLPFVDEDPKTAEIISKVILFAEDHKLKDPTILGQITK